MRTSSSSLVGLTVGLLVAARAGDAPAALSRGVRTLLLVVLAQGVVGFVQYATDLPVALVAAHVLGACLVWVATLRVVLSTRQATDRRSREALAVPLDPVVLEHEPGDAAHA